MGVEANATSSTTIVVKWGDVPREHQNGQIEGFKVYYGSNPRLPFQVCTFICNVMIDMWHPALSLKNKKETELSKYEVVSKIFQTGAAIYAAVVVA